jgi:hypothetical protein
MAFYYFEYLRRHNVNFPLASQHGTTLSKKRTAKAITPPLTSLRTTGFFAGSD